VKRRTEAEMSRSVIQRIKSWLGNPAGEGNWHPGPYHVSDGWLPSGTPWNFFQLDIDPLPFPGSSIVEACVWAYIRAIAQLPGYHRRELENGGTETITSSALARLLRTPNPYQTPSDFLVHLIRSLLLNGNSYWIAQRNDRQEVDALHWTDPRACRVREVQISGQQASEVFYEIGDNPVFQFESILGRQTLIVPARDVLHIKLATPRHPLVGETWLAALAAELAQRNAINASQTNTAVHMRTPGVIHTELVLTEAQIEEVKASWERAAVRMKNGGAPPVLTRNLQFQPISMSAEDQQIIEQLKMNDRMVAAVFGVPPILLGITDTGTAKSAEAVMAEWLAAGLGWLINHIELSLDQFVGLNSESVGKGREYTEFDTKALLRSLFKDRVDALVRGVQGGVYAPNEARRVEGLPEVDEGDEPRVQQQLVPLSFASEPPPPRPSPASASAPAAPPAPPSPPSPPPAAPVRSFEHSYAVVKFQLRKEINGRRAA
jgi:HK97 family phage portal protein